LILGTELSILAALIAACVSGVGGLALFMEALYRLFQEGKISRAVYEQLVEIVTIVTKRFIKVPVEHLL
jgi:Co/Zn/Cd efflux system component